MSSVRTRSAPPGKEGTLVFDKSIESKEEKEKQEVRKDRSKQAPTGLDLGLRGSGWTRMREDDDQATKGTRWMPRRQEARKDVGSCEKRRGAANQALIRRYPNGETQGR
jgi:hypothetical protein